MCITKSLKITFVCLFIFMIFQTVFIFNSFYFHSNQREITLGEGLDFTGKTDNTKVFQDALNKLEKSGGVIYIPSGTFLISQLKIPSYVQLIGTGKSTVLKMKKENNKPLIVLKNNATQMVHLKNFMIDGNKDVQTSKSARGIEFINTKNSDVMLKHSIKKEHDARHWIENIYISDTKGDGFYIEGRGESQIKGLQVLRSDGVGINSNAQDNWFTDCSSGDSGYEGLLINKNATNTRYNNCKAWFSGRINSEKGDGFLAIASRVSITGSEAQDNSKHGFVFTGDDIVGTGLIAEANGWSISTKEIRKDGTGFLLYGTSNSNIQGIAADRFLSEGSHQSYAVQLLNNSSGNIIQITSSKMRLQSIPNDQLSNNNKLIIVEQRKENEVHIIEN